MAARQSCSCDLLTSALKLMMATGDEFDLRRFDPSTYGYDPVPCEVLHSNPNFTTIVHVKDGIDLFSFALYADGACWGNGTPQARASVGVFGYPGADYNDGCVLPSDVPQTNQSAEIHSAIAALDVATMLLESRWENDAKCPAEKCVSRDSRRSFYVVLLVMDSEYVVKAMTEWIRKWRGNGFCNNRGFPVANMRALLTLDNLVRSLFEKHLVIVRFWHVPRGHNLGAHVFATNALRGDHVGNFRLCFEADEIVARLDRARLRD